MIDIDKLENALYMGVLQKSYGLKLDNGEVISMQDLAPAVADYLHAEGVDIDWADRSRFREYDRGGK